MSGSVLARVTLICGALIMGMSVTSSAVVQWRAFWADAWHQGFYSKTEIDNMISRAVQGRYNAIVAEVMGYQDNTGTGHGAFWNSSILPKAVGINPSGLPSGDPLAYLCQQAHANGIEVHCWLVAFRVSTSWPPSGNATLQAHPEWFMTTKANMGAGPSPVGSVYVLDPGCPGAQEYLASIVRELVTNYQIDGIHWDYIRYTQTDAGYPADSSYLYSGLRRFQRIYNRSDVPNATGDTQWNDFRRRTITEIVSRCRFESPAITSNPRQPLRHSASLITWGDCPSNFHSTNAYALFQDWEYWMLQGYLDAACPMCYYSECTYPTWYRNWVTNSVGWSHNRHLFIGQANYLNTMADSITQLLYAYNKTGVDGTLNYSYYATNIPACGSSWVNDWSWYTYIATNLFTSPATPPTMPWRIPATATEGTLYGRVIDGATGLPVDDASVTPSGAATVKTDGNGYYIATLLSAVSTGTTYSVAAGKTGYTTQTRSAVITPAGLTRLDFVLGAPVISNVRASNISTNSATISWNTDLASDSQVEYGTTPSYGQMSTLNPNLVTSHAVALSGLLDGTVYYYRVRSKTGAGVLSVDGPYTFTTIPAVVEISKSFGAGWSLMSVPLAPVNADPLVVFSGIPISGSLHRYEGGGYVTYWDFNPSPFGTVKLGDGYWLHLDAPATVRYSGTSSIGMLAIALPGAGWRMIGHVQQEEQPLANCEVRDTVTSEAKTFAAAADAGWIASPLYWYDPTNSGYLTCGIDPWDSDDSLYPWSGYWLCTLRGNLELRVPKP